MDLGTSLRLCALVLIVGCAHVEAEAHSSAAPAAPPAPAPDPNVPATTLQVASTPIESLRSPYFSALAFTFQNPSSEWHEVRRIKIEPERQLFGPALESLVGERLRAWQLATREAQEGKEGARHPALETLAPEAPPQSAPGGGEATAAAAGPASYLLACPFTIAPGLFTRKWIVLYSAAADALLGQDLVLSYELENGKTERVLVQYPKPASKP
jgi:hypothetical protein